MSHAPALSTVGAAAPVNFLRVSVFHIYISTRSLPVHRRRGTSCPWSTWWISSAFSALMPFIVAISEGPAARRAGSQCFFRRELRLEKVKLLGTTSVERLQPFAELAICLVGRARVLDMLGPCSPFLHLVRRLAGSAVASETLASFQAVSSPPSLHRNRIAPFPAGYVNCCVSAYKVHRWLWLWLWF